ncbi:MAG: hypothetical protein EP329_09525 [Deltaproteobacteria bacterium]|nr:MAG: hypothetical protein EP329_09525 [Deltaproteobacteria bacterium]
MNRLTTLACCLALPVALTTFACGDGGSSSADTQSTADVTEDTGSAADTAVAGDDTATTSTEDTATSADDTYQPYVPTEPSYAATCTEKGFPTYAEQFSAQQGLQVYQAVTTNKDPYTVLSFEFYAGDYGGASAPGTYDLSGSNYETCGNCVLVRTGCNSASGTCQKTYYADAGELVIDRWETGGKFSGHLQGVVLKEVTIDPTTYHSTPVAGGGEWCLDQYVFEADVAAPVVGGGNTQPTCVEEGTGTLVNDNIANFSLPNCYGEQVALHDSCGKKAMWLIGTAGWCSACHELLTAMVADYGGSLSRKKVNTRYPGLDLLIVLGENQYGANPSQAYCQAYAEDLDIDPAMVLIDNNPNTSDIPLIDPPGYALPVESFATTWTNMNPYLVAEGDGVTVSTPWHMVLRATNMEYMWTDNLGGAATLEGTLNTLLSE